MLGASPCRLQRQSCYVPNMSRGPGHVTLKLNSALTRSIGAEAASPLFHQQRTARVPCLIDPASKLATARGLDDETATCSLGQVLKLGAVNV
jgi:hypothetical protein